jgi:Crinkler effector protein N-terminal domain
VFKLFCWPLDGSRAPFTVEIGASKIVDDLKNVIRKRYDSDSLTLWKVGSFMSLMAFVIIAADTVLLAQ